MSQKGSSEGSVYYNKARKRWTAQYYELNFETENRKRKTKDFKSEEEAQKYLQSVMYQKESPLYIEHNGIPLIDLMNSNLKLKYDTNIISEMQYGRVLRSLNTIKKSTIANKKIDNLTSEEIQGYVNTLKNLSNSSINKIFEQFNQAFRYATNKGYIMRNPMVNVIKPKSLKKDKKVRALTVEEQQKLTDWISQQNPKEFLYKNVYLIQMYMGLRIGETLALNTRDIDLKNKKVHVYKTLTNGLNGEIIMGNSTKTYAGIREVPIPTSLYPHIVEQIRIAEENVNNTEKLLFKPPKNQYTDRENVNVMLKKILKDNWDIDSITTHSLRHTYGTRCIEAGMQPVVLQRLMGHTDISTTLNVYTDVLNEFKQEEIDKVNQYYMKKDLLSNGNDIKEIER